MRYMRSRHNPDVVLEFISDANMVNDWELLDEWPPGSPATEPPPAPRPPLNPAYAPEPDPSAATAQPAPVAAKPAPPKNRTSKATFG
jgi:hypothetical protein